MGFVFFFLLITDVYFSAIQRLEIEMCSSFFGIDFPHNVLVKYIVSMSYQEISVCLSSFRLRMEESCSLRGGSFLMLYPFPLLNNSGAAKRCK